MIPKGGTTFPLRISNHESRHALSQFLLDDYSWNRGDRDRDDVGVHDDVIDSARGKNVLR